MFEPHKYTLRPPDAQAPCSALRQDLPNISFDPLGDVATIAAVEDGDCCALLEAFDDGRTEELKAAVSSFVVTGDKAERLRIWLKNNLTPDGRVIDKAEMDR